MTSDYLQPSQGVAPAHAYIVLHIHPECQYHIYDNRGAQGKEGYVDEPEAYTGGSYAYMVANGGAYAKGLPLDEILDIS